MLLIQKNALFIHVPKTGGNSIQNILRHYSDDKIIIDKNNKDGVERFGVRNEEYNTKKHSSLSYYKSVLDYDIYSSFFKFATIRNPWDMMISFYFSPNTGVAKWNRDDFLILVNKSKTLRYYICESTQTDKKLDSADEGLDVDIDYLIRFERIDEDFKILCEKLGISNTPLPKRNSSARTHYSKYYDDDLIEIVGRKFREEIDFGSYSFERC